MMKLLAAVAMLALVWAILFFPEAIDPQCQFILSPEKCQP
jgi:hypothetical protein